jgi:hypothetical protein
VKCWKIYQANGPRKQAGVAILISDKLDFKLTLIKRDKEGHSTLIKGEIHQKGITIINLYAPNVNAPNFIKHTLKDLKTYIDSNTVVVEDLNTPLSPTERSSRHISLTCSLVEDNLILISDSAFHVLQCAVLLTCIKKVCLYSYIGIVGKRRMFLWLFQIAVAIFL